MKSKIIIALLAVVTLMSCNNNKSKNSEPGEHTEKEGPEGVVLLNPQQREALDLELGTFQMRNLTTMVKTNGEMQVPPASSAEVTAVIGGNVRDIRVFHGDKVRRGQTLAILEHPDYIKLQEDFAELASRLEFLEMEYERQKELFENNVGAGREFQQVKSEYNSAKAKYQGLKARLQLLHLSPEKVKEGEISNSVPIVSPINGYVNEIDVKVGTYAGAQDMLFEITDNSEIHADFLVYENDVHLLEKGQKVHFTAANIPDKELTATIFAIGQEFEANARAVHVHASLDETVPGLIPGMYISGHILTDENYTRTLPNDAIVSEGTKSYIFVLDEEATEAEHGHEVNHADEDEHAHDETHAEESDEEHARHEEGTHEGEGDEVMAFRMVEVVAGLQDEGYTEVKLLNPLPDDTQIVMNTAYYLLSDLKKDEAGDDD
ncbi:MULTISPECIES: efflux RND transporter periplasmic adaptor subunit [Marinilabilia]|uniref:Cobalt-zinc-cadmium efflux system membrane fusion protein n=1 Tax=Marinilabilia salmonicolor TaxID=989 RepID=A0A368VD59_9BACT|nr:MULTISPECIES: efflux RND transporter periplasmic adaptor subunit [Marinilabilia]RCW39052.1 cobalt-zinc-cadmium efflux system membrane fusion protein [Marinilabilia salmonicolor]